VKIVARASSSLNNLASREPVPRSLSGREHLLFGQVIYL
jgi:hypothetical protein